MLLVRIGALAGFKAGTRTGAGGGGAQAVLCWPTVGPARCKWQQAVGSRVWAGGALGSAPRQFHCDVTTWFERVDSNK